MKTPTAFHLFPWTYKRFEVKTEQAPIFLLDTVALSLFGSSCMQTHQGNGAFMHCNLRTEQCALTLLGWGKCKPFRHIISKCGRAEKENLSLIDQWNTQMVKCALFFSPAVCLKLFKALRGDEVEEEEEAGTSEEGRFEAGKMAHFQINNTKINKASLSGL